MTAYDQTTDLHHVSYDDGDKKELNMENKSWRILQTHHIYVFDLSTIHKEAHESCSETFAHKEFMFYQVEGIPPYPVWNLYVGKEQNL